MQISYNHPRILGKTSGWDGYVAVYALNRTAGAYVYFQKKNHFSFHSVAAMAKKFRCLRAFSS